MIFFRRNEKKGSDTNLYRRVFILSSLQNYVGQSSSSDKFENLEIYFMDLGAGSITIRFDLDIACSTDIVNWPYNKNKKTRVL